MKYPRGKASKMYRYIFFSLSLSLANYNACLMAELCTDLSYYSLGRSIKITYNLHNLCPSRSRSHSLNEINIHVPADHMHRSPDSYRYIYIYICMQIYIDFIYTQQFVECLRANHAQPLSYFSLIHFVVRFSKFFSRCAAAQMSTAPDAITEDCRIPSAIRLSQ